MRFEDVMNMDVEPFDENVLKRVYYSGYGTSPSMPDIYAALIFHYFFKFDERYGTRLAESVGIMQLLSIKEEENDTLLWHEEAPSLMDAALLESGWDAAWIFATDEDLVNVVKSNSKVVKKRFHEKYTKYIEEIVLDDFAKACLLQEEGTALDAAYGMDEGYLGIMWNEKLERYEKLQEKNRDLISALCPDEDRYISQLKKDIWEPYIDAFVQETGDCQGTKYIRILIGCDGYTYNFFDSINPNWICRAIQLNRVLDIALGKIGQFQSFHEKEAS